MSVSQFAPRQITPPPPPPLQFAAPVILLLIWSEWNGLIPSRAEKKGDVVAAMISVIEECAVIQHGRKCSTRHIKYLSHGLEVGCSDILSSSLA